MLTARTKTIERTGTGRQFPPSLASLSATKFSLQIYMELTGVQSKSKYMKRAGSLRPKMVTRKDWVSVLGNCILDCKGTAACQVEFVLKYITANGFVSFIR